MRMRRRPKRMAVGQRRMVMPAIALVLVVSACGGGDDTGANDLSSEQGGQDQQSGGGGDGGDGLGAALGAGGGGGVLVFDGQEIEITGVTCILDADTFDVGTVSDEGHRVFVTRNNPANDVSAQVLDPDFLQWFPQGVSGDEAQRDGGTFTSEPKPYFNNSDDRIIEISFTIECP